MALLGALALTPHVASAHAANTSYLRLGAADSSAPVTLTWDLAAKDLDWTIDLDLDANGAITWGEIEARRDAITALAIKGLSIERGGQPCVVSPQDLALTRHIDALFVSLGLTVRCAAGGSLSVASSLFFSQDASQRVLVQADVGRDVFNSVLSPSEPRWMQPAMSSPLETFARFIKQGVAHVWSGWDHIAFVLLLILPTAWLAGASKGAVFKELLSVITTFTVAHSITLSLAATHIVQLPERFVEIAITASLVAAAVMNLTAPPLRWRLGVAFGFGLMHGFGFARALLEIDVSGTHLLPMLAGFNVGVELAQLIIVLIALPLLLRLQTVRSRTWRERLLREPALARHPAHRRGSSCSSGS
jgi:hypothetical protein